MCNYMYTMYILYMVYTCNCTGASIVVNYATSTKDPYPALVLGVPGVVIEITYTMYYAITVQSLPY